MINFSPEVFFLLENGAVVFIFVSYYCASISKLILRILILSTNEPDFNYFTFKSIDAVQSVIIAYPYLCVFAQAHTVMVAVFLLCYSLVVVHCLVFFVSLLAAIIYSTFLLIVYAC